MTALGLAVATTSAGMFAGFGLPLTSLLEIGAALSALELTTRYLRRRRRFAHTTGRLA